MPHHSASISSTTTTLTSPSRRASKSKPSSIIRLFPYSPPRPTTQLSSSNATINNMTSSTASPARPLSSLCKPRRKVNAKSNKSSEPVRSTAVQRVSTPALPEQASHSDTPHRSAVKKSRSSQRSKPRDRARSLSPIRLPVLSALRSPLQPTDLNPNSASPNQRTRTVTLDDQPTFVKFQATSPRHPQSSLDFLAHPPCKSVRPKRSSKANKRSTKFRNERRRTCTASSDESDAVINFDPIEISPTLETSLTVQPQSNRVSSPQDIDVQDVTVAKSHFAPSHQNSAQPSLLTNQPPFIGVTLRPEPQKSKGSSRHGRAKSVASLADVAKSTEADFRSSKSVKDDWDMPPSADGTALTWQQRKKPKPKSTSAIDHEVPHMTPPPASNLTKKLSQNEPATGISPLLRSTSLRARPNTIVSRRGRAGLARTPSAGNVQSGPGLFGSNASGGGMTLFGSDRPSAILQDGPTGSLSVPPSPTPDRSSFGKIPTPTAMSHPIDIGHPDDSSLTWQQAIMRSSPPKNVYHSGSLAPTNLITSSSVSENLKSGKKNMSNPSAFTTPVKSATLSYRRSGPHPRMPMTDDVPNNRSGSVAKSNSKITKRRNSMSSTPNNLKSHSNPSPVLVTASPPCLVQQPELETPDKREDRSGSVPTPTAIVSLHASSRSNGKKLLHRSSTPLPIIPSMSGLKPSNDESGKASKKLQTLEPGALKVNVPSASNLNVTMYAGPQFHNSPSPAALPPPKFSYT
ncbi:hypothetical protein DFH28DRAFT_354316 [Melampsora americana]|nr:hypothetical protein DFH28DRAFT_354316 [Melampsora americana]